LHYSSSIKRLSKPISKEEQETDSLESLLIDKVNVLQDLINQIDFDENQRKALSYQVLYRLYQHYFYAKTYLFQIDQWQMGSQRHIEQRRSKLEQELSKLKQEKRQEQILCFQDILKLRQEKRNWLKQFGDLSRRVKLVLPQDSNNL